MMWIVLSIGFCFFAILFLWKFGNGNGLVRQNVIKTGTSKDSTSESTKKESELSVNLLFSAGLSQLDSQELDQLEKLLKSLQKESLISIEISGSADSTGNLARNRKLVRDRVQFVRSILQKQGKLISNLNVVYQEPIPGRTAKERERLRAVRLRIKYLEVF